MTTFLGATKSGNFLKISCAMMTTRWKLSYLPLSFLITAVCSTKEKRNVKGHEKMVRKIVFFSVCVFFCLCFLFEVTYILERMWLSKWRQENSTTDTQLRKPSMAEDLVAAQIQSYISNQSQYATKKTFQLWRCLHLACMFTKRFLEHFLPFYLLQSAKRHDQVVGKVVTD